MVCLRRQRGGRCSSTPIHNLVVEGGEWAAPHCSHFTCGKDSVPVVQEAGLRPVWTARKILLQPGFNLLIVQHVAIHYADYGLFRILLNILQMWLENKVCVLFY